MRQRAGQGLLGWEDALCRAFGGPLQTLWWGLRVACRKSALFVLLGEGLARWIAVWASNKIPLRCTCILAQSRCLAMSSPPTTPMSQASTRFGIDSSISLDDAKSLRRRATERVKQVSPSRDLFLFLVAFRILNALSLETFFQPDEFFQSLEPAWEIAFGANSGAWITWVIKPLPEPLTKADAL